MRIVIESVNPKWNECMYVSMYVCLFVCLFVCLYVCVCEHVGRGVEALASVVRCRSLQGYETSPAGGYAQILNKV